MQVRSQYLLYQSLKVAITVCLYHHKRWKNHSYPITLRVFVSARWMMDESQVICLSTTRLLWSIVTNKEFKTMLCILLNLVIFMQISQQAIHIIEQLDQLHIHQIWINLYFIISLKFMESTICLKLWEMDQWQLLKDQEL